MSDITAARVSRFIDDLVDERDAYKEHALRCAAQIKQLRAENARLRMELGQ